MNHSFFFSLFWLFGAVALDSLPAAAEVSTAEAAFAACDLTQSEYESRRQTLEIQKIEKTFEKFCNFEDRKSLGKEEEFFLNKWGPSICSTLMSRESAYSMKCRYTQIVAQKKLNSAEALAIAGYTAEYHGYLKPHAIALKPQNKNYEGFDVFNRILKSAIHKLGQYPEFQYNETVYRGDSLRGRSFVASEAPFRFQKWTSSSCVKEVAFGPDLIPMSAGDQKELEARIRAAEGLGPDDEISGLQDLLYSRNPRSVQDSTTCQKKYFADNPTPPLSPDAHFGSGDLMFTILPTKSGPSRRVAIYGFSKRSEAEILFPADTAFLIKKVIEPDAPDGDKITTQVTLEEIPSPEPSGP